MGYGVTRVIIVACHHLLPLPVCYMQCIEALVKQVLCLKRFITFQCSELLHLRLMGISVPSLHIESTDSLMVYA